MSSLHETAEQCPPDQTHFPVSSCLSMRSNISMGVHHDFSKDVADGDQHDVSPVEMDGNQLFKLVEKHSWSILLSEQERYKRMLFPHLSQRPEAGDTLSTGDNSASEAVLNITLHVLKEMGQRELANTLEKCVYGELDVCQRKLRHKLKKFEYIYEGVAQHRSQTLLNEVYTELYITEGGSWTLNSEHEVRMVEAATRRQATEDRPIKCEDIFKPMPRQQRFIRTVLTRGIAGIGKTISVQKFNLEWADGRANQDIQLLINLPFRELNVMKERRLTLTQLLHHFLAEAKESGIVNFDKYKVALIFDGLDECRLPLDFEHNAPCRSASEPASVDELLTNVIQGNLMPSSHIWITSRPAAAHRIPVDVVDRVTEVRGFTDPQKEEYFRKKISDQDMAAQVISHIKSSRSLHIMCHIPVFSWISATVLQEIFEERGRKREMPKTLTQMYAHFVVYNSLMGGRKYSAGQGRTKKMDEETILKLGKIAFEHLMKGNMIFYEEEVTKYISIADAALCSGVFTQTSENDLGFQLARVYCFVHLSIQEFYAALYVFHTLICLDQNLLQQSESVVVQEAAGGVTSLLKGAVDEALQSDNGHLDLFLRFLLGLSQTSNQLLLKSILTTVRCSPQRNEEIVDYIKEKIRQNPSPERCINLFHCLSELNDQELLEEIQKYLSSGRLPETQLSPSQWSALVFVLQTSKEQVDEFDLRKYSRSEEGFVRLQPLIRDSRVALLKECNLTEKCCKALGALLCSSSVKELDVSDNDLQDSGVDLLSAGLASPTCQLEKLRMLFCGVTDAGFACLARALRTNPHLKELDLSYNHLGQAGLELLSSLQKDVGHLTVRVSASAECYLKSALKKYACELTLDVNTAHSHLAFSDDNKKMTRMETAQPYPDGPERFTDWGQVLTDRGLSARCYWEVEWSGEWMGVGVAYKGISRKAKGNDCVLGYNDQSWSLRYYQGKYTACHNKCAADISVPYFQSKRVGVFLDWSAGTLSFYAVSLNAMKHLHTFQTQFSEPLYPGFRVGFVHSSMTLCQPEII